MVCPIYEDSTLELLSETMLVNPDLKAILDVAHSIATSQRNITSGRNAFSYYDDIHLQYGPHHAKTCLWRFSTR